MRPSSRIVIAVFLCGLFLSTAAATAQVVIVPFPDVTVTGGYSYMKTQKVGDLFYDHSGAYIDANVAWSLPLKAPLELGFGVTGSGYEERKSINNGNYIYDNYNNSYDYGYDDLYSDLGFFELEPRIGLRLGGPRGFFAVPRLGAGLLVNSYSIDRAYNSNGYTYLTTDQHTGAAFEIRPAIQVGYTWRCVTAGIEGSFMYSWGDFGELGRNAREFRVGVFLGFNF